MDLTQSRSVNKAFDAAGGFMVLVGEEDEEDEEDKVLRRKSFYAYWVDISN